MKVIAAKHITDAARAWLCDNGAAIEQMRGLVIVFLPRDLRFWQSELRGVPHYITLGTCGIPTVFVESGSDDSRSIYARGDDDA